MSNSNNNSYNNFNNSNNANNLKYNSLGVRDESGTSISSSLSPSPSSPPPIHHYQPSHARKGSDLNNSNNSINTNYNINNSNNISSFPQTKSNLVTPVNPKRYLANSQNKFYPNKSINDNNNNNNYNINNSYNSSNNFNNTNNFNNNNNNNTTTPLLSNDKNQEKKERKPRSKIHFLSLVCVMSLGFIANVEYGVIMPSIWKYISSLGGNKMQMGVAISACSAAQVCFLPIFGWWSDKRTMKEVYIVAILIGVLGNAMYASAQFLGSPWLIVGGRTLIGIYSGATSVSNSFIACVTTPQTRTRFMAHLNGINALGLVTGPAFNLFLAKIHVSIVPHLSIDDLTSPAWFVGALLCISLLFFMFLFREPTLAEEVDTTSNKIVDEESGQVPHSPSLSSSPSLSPAPSSSPSLSPAPSSSPSLSPDPSAPTTTPADNSKLTLSQFISFLLGSFTKPWGVCFLVNFVQNFDFSVLETVVTLFTTQFYHFNTFQNSLMYSAMSLEMIVIIILTAIASKKVSDRMIIVVGMVFMGAGVILLLVIFNDKSPFYMFVIIVAVLLIGMPSQNIAVMSCYSQLIDLEYPNAKQGLYSGVMMVFGSSARIVGPLWGGFATGLSPETHAIRILASLLAAMFGLEFICTTIFYRKLRTDQPSNGTKQTEKSKLLPEIG